MITYGVFHLFSSFRRYIITLIYQYSIATYYDAFLQVFRNVVEVHFSIIPISSFFLNLSVLSHKYMYFFVGVVFYLTFYLTVYVLNYANLNNSIAFC